MVKIEVFNEEKIKNVILTIMWLIWQAIPVLVAIHCAFKTTESVSLLIIQT